MRAGAVRPPHVHASASKPETAGGQAGHQAVAGETASADVVARLLARERQQALVARVGELALTGTPFEELAGIVVREVSELVEADCGISELLPDRKYRVVAGTGWIAALAGSLRPLEGGANVQSEHAVTSTQPVIYEDLQSETRFTPARVLLEHGIRSGVTAIIPFHGRSWGPLSVFSTQPRRFTVEDAHFLETLAQVLASVLERLAMEAALTARVRQQASLARLGREALSRELHDLLGTASSEVATTLEADFCKILELDRDGRLLVLRAGVGWRPGSIGQAIVPADTHSQAGFALRSDRAVIVDDLATEKRFEPARLLTEHGVVSGMSVIIRGRTQPYGVIGVHSRHRRAFSEDDIDYLETVAALLGAAIERLRVQDELRQHRAHLEEEVADRTRQLAASNRELEAFSYSVSHDLRAPLRTITGYSTLLSARHADSLGPESLRLLDAIQSNAQRLGRLIDDLMDLSRVQQVDLLRERVDLSEVATTVLAQLRAAEPAREVTATIQPDLWVEGDVRLLGMLVENLVANAWKFTRRTPDATIQVSRTGADGNAVYCVKDNGAGFDMAYADRLFQPFQRLHRASEFEGTGVGLATVKRIIERHGGRIWAEGRPGGGAAFYFTLGGARKS